MRLISFIFYSTQTGGKRKRRTPQHNQELYKMATSALKQVEQQHYEDYLVVRFMCLNLREEWSSVVSD
jgi:hypothetical protein